MAPDMIVSWERPPVLVQETSYSPPPLPQKLGRTYKTLTIYATLPFPKSHEGTISGGLLTLSLTKRTCKQPTM